MIKLLAVMPPHTHYNPNYEVSVARSYEEAKFMILRAEQEGVPFDTLDLPVRDEKMFWQFLEWMRTMGRNYSFSVFGCKDDAHFRELCKEAREKGFHFNT